MACYLYVKDYSSETTIMDLIMYFQSKESGGGDIDDEFCKIDNKIAMIAFDDDNDLKRVLSKDHNLKGSKLTTSSEPFNPKPKAPPRTRKTQAPPNAENNKPIIGEIKTVIATGIPPETTDDHLHLFFQNKRRSGGGDIENIQRVEPQVAHVTFVSAQVAERVLEKGNLEIDGYLLQLKATKPKVTFPKDKKKLFIENLDPKTSKDSLTNYVEVITGLEVKDLVFGNDKNAMATLDDEPDMNEVTKKAKKKPLEGAELKITNPPVCHSVLMTGFSKKTTKDAIELKFENTKHGGGDILDVVYEKEQGKAVISFLDPNVVRGIISKEHVLNDAKIIARPYYPFLDEKVVDMPRNIKKVIEVSHDVMDHVSNRCDKEFLQEFGFDIAKIKYDEEKKKLTFPITLPTGELIEKRIEAIESYFNQFTVEELDVPQHLFVNSKDEVEETLAETMKSFKTEAHAAIEEEKRCIVVTGKKKNISKVVKALQTELNKLEKRKELLTTQLFLQQHKLMLIIALGFEERFESESNIEVKIDPQNGVMTLKGSKQLVESAKVQILEEITTITEERIDLSENQEDYLMSGGLQKINDGLKKRKVNALVCLDKSKPRKAIVELLKPEKFEKVKKYLSEQVFEERFAVEEESVDLLKSEKWSAFRDTLQQNSGIKIYTCIVGHLEVNIWLTGEKHLVKQCHEKLEHFMKINTIISESITVDQTIARHLSRFCNNKMKEIEDSLNNLMAKFGRKEASLTVQGTKEGVKKAKAKLQDTIDDLAYRMIPVEKPGMQKYLESVAGKASLGGIESKHQCTINLTTEGKQRSKQISSIGNPRSTIPSTMLLCSYETPEKILLKVYQADITTHACDVIVNAANSELRHIGSLAKMIVDQGGKVIQDDCDEYIRKNRTLSPGECYKGIPGKLPCKHIIHTVAPQWDKNNPFRDRRYLEFACESTLEAAKNHSSIALPAVGSGINQVPKDVCADVMVEVAVKFSSKNGRKAALKEIHFVNNDSTTATSFLKEFRKRFGDKPTFAESFSKRGPRKFIQDKGRGEIRKAQFNKMTSGKSDGRSSPENGDRITTNTNATISVVVGDLSTHQADVLVNTTSESLKLDSNPCSRALSNEAGPVLQQKCNQVGKLNLGQVAFTEGGNLLCKQVCHVLCTKWNNGQGEKVLRSIIKNCLTKSQSLGMKSIAFPAIGTGILGFPHDITAKICFDESKEYAKKNPTTCLKDINFVVYDQDQASIKAFKDELRKQREWVQTGREVGSRNERRIPEKIDCSLLDSSIFVMPDPESAGTNEKDGWGKPQLFLEMFAEKIETLTKVANDIAAIMAEQMKKENIEDEFISELDENCVSRIIKIGKKNIVEMTIQKPVNRIIVHGHTEDVSKVIIEVKSLLNEVKLAEQVKENAKMVSQGVQWFWEKTDGSQVKYNVSLNSKIERAYIKKKKSVTFTFIEDKCEIDFENMQKTNHTTKVKAKVFRKDFNTKGDAPVSIAVPAYWDPQPKGANGKKLPLHNVPLGPTIHNEEYKKIRDGFLRTANTNTILKIERIQNPSLFKLYATKKKNMDEQDGSNEKFLYHGTEAKNVSDINLNGLNRSYNGVNGTAYGRGIYFASSAKYSVGYAKPDISGTRYMYVARVATGQFTVGNNAMIVPPKRAEGINYDSVVDNVANPSFFVMFYDNQYYPEYLITFR